MDTGIDRQADPSSRRSRLVALVLVAAALALILHQHLTAPHPENSPRPRHRARAARSHTPAAPTVEPAAPALPAPEAPREPPAEAPALDLVLTAVVLDPDDPEASFAVVGGRAVRTGESVGAARVARVLADRIVLEPGGELLLPPPKKE